MAIKHENAARHRIAIDDVLACALGLAAGPLLWWMSSMWQQVPAASSAQTLEYWIASICGFVGVALCVLWSLYGLAGFGLILGLKTRNAVLTYWSEVLTPRFLRRLITAVIGAQVALTSQAFAATPEDPSPTMQSPQLEDPFMPYVHEEPEVERPSADSTTSDSPVSTLQPNASPEPTTPVPETPLPSATGESRQESKIVVTPEPRAVSHPTPDIEPAPRQTSTIDTTPKKVQNGSDVPQAPAQQNYVPQQPVTAPNIAAPSQSPGTEKPTVVVTAGDCLWDIAVHELGTDVSLAEIDRRWRQWWEHNHGTIGDDPHTLTPGTVLTAPPFS